MGSFSIEKAKKSLQGARVTQGAFGSNGRGQSGSMTEGILIATELAGFAHPGGDVPPKHRLHRSTIPFPPLQTKCRDGTMLQEYYIDLYFIIYKSEHVTHHARKVHCFAQSISDVERSGKKYSVRSTTLSPPGCLSSNLSGRREGSVLPFFFVHFHLQRWAEHISTLMFEIRIWKATNCLLDERVYMSFRHATGCQVISSVWSITTSHQWPRLRAAKLQEVLG